AFVFVGLQPNTAFLANTIKLTESGFIPTTPTLETSVQGIFAAGDALAGSTKHLGSAPGEGATAALMIRHYLQTIGAQTVPDEARSPMVMQMAGMAAQTSAAPRLLLRPLTPSAPRDHSGYAARTVLARAGVLSGG